MEYNAITLYQKNWRKWHNKKFTGDILNTKTLLSKKDTLVSHQNVTETEKEPDEDKI